MTRISELETATSFSGADLAVIVQSGVTKKITATNFSDAAVAAVIGTINESQRWRSLADDLWTATPASTSRISTSYSGYSVGLPIRYINDGNTMYGVVSAVTSGAHIDIRGPSINTAVPITGLAVGGSERVAQVDIFISGTYAASTGQKVRSIMKSYPRWVMGKAHLVSFSAAHHTVDSGTQPKINVKINGTDVSTQDASQGIQMAGTAGAWSEAGLATIARVASQITYGSEFEVDVKAAGGSANASNLTVVLTIVLE